MTLCEKTIKNWKTILVGDNNFYESDCVKVVTEVIDENADIYLKNICLNNSEFLWENEDEFEDFIKHISESYNRIRTLALAYSLKSSKFFKNKEVLNTIIYSLEWMYEKIHIMKYTEKHNCYQSNISIPLSINDILILINKEISIDSIKKYINEVYRFYRTLNDFQNDKMPLNISHRIFFSKIILINKALVGDEKGVSELIESLKQFIFPIENDNGIYEDGSFLHHNCIPANCTYGIVLMDSISAIMLLLSLCGYNIRAKQKESVYKMIYNVYEPFIYKGLAMDMVRGRDITKDNTSDYKAAFLLISSVTKLAFLDKRYSKEFKSMVKLWLNTPFEEEYFKSVDLYTCGLTKSILSDNSVIPWKEGVLSKVYGCMDKIVHRRKDFTITISMNSNRTYKCKCITEEEKFLKNACNGMIYVYTKSLFNFNNGFWNRVDRNHLPGITTSHSYVCEKNQCEEEENFYSSKSFVGGVTFNEKYTSGVMEGQCTGASFKKSYFLLDDEIVCIGNVSAEKNFKTETTIENKKFQGGFYIDLGKRAAYVEEKKYSTKKDIIVFNTSEESISYYNPLKHNLNITIEEDENNKEYGQKYFKLVMDHKKMEDSYLYYILPNKDIEYMKNYVDNSEVQIISKSKEMHSIYYKKENLEMYNCFKKNFEVSDLLFLNKMCLIFKRDENKITFYMSNVNREEEVSFIFKTNVNFKFVGKNIKCKKIKEGFKFTLKDDNGASFKGELMLRKK